MAKYIFQKGMDEVLSRLIKQEEIFKSLNLHEQGCGGHSLSIKGKILSAQVTLPSLTQDVVH